LGYDGDIPLRYDASMGDPRFKALFEAAHARRHSGAARRRLQPFGPEGKFPSASMLVSDSSRGRPQGALVAIAIQLTGPTRARRGLLNQNAAYWMMSFILTGCASTPSTRSRMIRGRICFAELARAPSLVGFIAAHPSHLEHEEHDPRRRRRPLQPGQAQALQRAMENDAQPYSSPVAARMRSRATTPAYARRSCREGHREGSP